MTAAFGNYDESYPPEILRGYEPPLVGGAARRAPAAPEVVEVEPVDEPVELGSVVTEPVEQPATASRTFTVTAGEPGSYEPDVAPRDRPRNVTELREVGRVADPAPWPAGAYVLVGTTGKRAHWDGDDWHGDESPGYPSAVDDPEVDEL